MAEKKAYIIPATLYMGTDEKEFEWATRHTDEDVVEVSLLKSITGSDISDKRSKIPTEITDAILTDFKEVFYEALRLENEVSCMLFFNEYKSLIHIKLTP